jgi:hypothetical protein
MVHFSKTPSRWGIIDRLSGWLSDAFDEVPFVIQPQRYRLTPDEYREIRLWLEGVYPARSPGGTPIPGNCLLVGGQIDGAQTESSTVRRFGTVDE